jgi:SpoVK/Ycf46/Vps4 family AAA+-type ATPase
MSRATAFADERGFVVIGGPAKEGKRFFLNIKGPELLNKYAETEWHIRLVFQWARQKACAGMPVIVFFDEMDSIIAPELKSLNYRTSRRSPVASKPADGLETPG